MYYQNNGHYLRLIACISKFFKKKKKKGGILIFECNSVVSVFSPGICVYSSSLHTSLFVMTFLCCCLSENVSSPELGFCLPLYWIEPGPVVRLCYLCGIYYWSEFLPIPKLLIINGRGENGTQFFRS